MSSANPKEDSDAEATDLWVEIVESSCREQFGNRDATVIIENVVGMSDLGSDSTRRGGILDNRSTGLKRRKIALILLIISAIFFIPSLMMLIQTDWENYDKVVDGVPDGTMGILIGVLLGLISIFPFLFSKPPHYRLTRNGNELIIESWLSMKDDSVIENTSNASLYTYKVNIESVKFVKILAPLIALLTLNPWLILAAIPEMTRSWIVVYFVDGEMKTIPPLHDEGPTGLPCGAFVNDKELDDFIKGFRG